MSQNGIAQRGIGQACNHGNLHGGHNLARADTEDREAEDAIAVCLYQRLHKSAGFGQRLSTKIHLHGDLEQPVGDALRCRFQLAEADAGELAISKQAVRNLSPRRDALAASDVGMRHTEIVNADVCELWASCNLADRPNAGRRCLQSLVDLNVSSVRKLDSGQLQPKSLSVRTAACRDEQVTARQDFLDSTLVDGNAHRPARLSRHSHDIRIQNNLDAFLLKQVARSLAHIVIFSGHQPLIAIDNGYFAAEAAHRLGQLYSDVAATDHK